MCAMTSPSHDDCFSDQIPENIRKEDKYVASSGFQTLKQFEWVPQHSRTRPKRQHPPLSFSRTRASFLAEHTILTPTRNVDLNGTNHTNPLCVSGIVKQNHNYYEQKAYAHVLQPAGLRQPFAKKKRTLSPLRCVNNYHGIWK